MISRLRLPTMHRLKQPLPSSATSWLTMLRVPRTLILPLITLNALFNIYALYRILDSWRGLNNNAESEWEGGGHGQQLARSLAAIFIAYIVLASTAAIIGFHGVYKRLVASVRLYLQFSFVDAVVYLISMISIILSVYGAHDWQDGLCEELSIHADLLRALRTGGFDIEHCEKWAEKLLMGGMTLLGLGLVLKIQFTLAIASYYTSLAKASGQPFSTTSLFASTLSSQSSSARVPPTRKLSKSSRRSSSHTHILLTQPTSHSRSPPTSPTRVSLSSGGSGGSGLPPYSDDVVSITVTSPTSPPGTTAALAAMSPTMGPEAAQAVAELIGRSTAASTTSGGGKGRARAGSAAYGYEYGRTIPYASDRELPEEDEYEYDSKRRA
ncbi:hypothetical protein DL93DRAFT_446330 [Clavulina sp. PMI_390]|nr:hypothetical protein DL93DRAFT_446330 [Clavulina sp. PMI_390]